MFPRLTFWWLNRVSLFFLTGPERWTRRDCRCKYAFCVWHTFKHTSVLLIVILPNACRASVTHWAWQSRNLSHSHAFYILYDILKIYYEILWNNISTIWFVGQTHACHFLKLGSPVPVVYCQHSQTFIDRFIEPYMFKLGRCYRESHSFNQPPLIMMIKRCF